MTGALRLRLLTAISVALAVLTASGAFAAGAPASSDGVVSFHRPAGDDPSAVARYWTAKRIAAARPLDARVNARGRLRVERSSAPRNHPIPFTSGPVTDAFLSGATVHGKLFARLKGLDHECSATSVNSLNRSVILTAGHCVYDRRKGFARKLAFVPAYNNHLRPLGTWPYDSVYIPREWYQRNDHDFDFAAVVTDPQDGRGVNDAVGAVPLVANYPREQQTYAAFGYPINFADAQQMWRCDSPYGGDDPNAGPRTQQPPIAIGCDMGDGASGGGWIVSGAGIGSLTSFSYDGHPDVLYGPYFGDRALAVFGKAELCGPGGGRGPGAPVRGLRPGVARLQSPLRRGRRAGASVQGPRAGQHQLPGLRRQPGSRARMRKRRGPARAASPPTSPTCQARPAGTSPSGRWTARWSSAGDSRSGPRTPEAGRGPTAQAAGRRRRRRTVREPISSSQSAASRR